MVKVVFAFFVVFVAAVCLELQLGGVDATAENEPTWCVAKPSSDGAILNQNIDYACSQTDVDCSVIKQTGAVTGLCYSPDTPINHASVAMNAYYQKNKHNPNTTGPCDFKDGSGKLSGLITISDPSYDGCKYAYSP